MRITILSILLLMFSAKNGLAQRSIKDSAIFTPLIAVTYGANAPGGYWMKSFGYTNTVGIEANFKTKKNWIYGIDGRFVFGNQLKAGRLNEIFGNIVNSNGSITAQSGVPADVLFLQRGFIINASVGKLFPWAGPNPNSGFVFRLGIGYMQHKIRIEHNQHVVPQLDGDYKKGYDHLHMGGNITEFIGYVFQSNNGWLNFTVGFEITQGFTQNIRPYNFDIKGPDKTIRFDALYGIKVGWIIPIYKRKSREFYYD